MHEVISGLFRKEAMTDPNFFIDEKEQIRFNEGKPIFVERGLKITKNPKTNKL